MADNRDLAGFTARPATPDDVERVVGLVNAAALVDTGLPATNHDEKRSVSYV